jgi:hypothetical protein
MKQKGQFKLENVTFYKRTRNGQLRCLPKNAPAHLILTADSATLKLDNQKNGWKGVCVCTRKQIATFSIAQLGRWDGAPYTSSQKPLMDLKNLHFILEDRDYSKIN